MRYRVVLLRRVEEVVAARRKPAHRRGGFEIRFQPEEVIYSPYQPRIHRRQRTALGFRVDHLFGKGFGERRRLGTVVVLADIVYALRLEQPVEPRILRYAQVLRLRVLEHAELVHLGENFRGNEKAFTVRRILAHRGYLRGGVVVGFGERLFHARDLGHAPPDEKLQLVRVGRIGRIEIHFGNKMIETEIKILLQKIERYLEHHTRRGLVQHRGRNARNYARQRRGSLGEYASV